MNAFWSKGGSVALIFIKIFSREQLQTAQNSALGVSLEPLTISGIGQADDTALVSNSIHNLN